MEILFTVCARAGSKGIRDKNIRPFLGFPLPWYTYSALELYLKDDGGDAADIALNTDSERLMELTAGNPFLPVEFVLREAGLAGDRVPKPAVIRSTLEQMEQRSGKRYDIVVDLDLTSPLRRVEDIRNLILKQKESRADVTFSVTDARRNPYFNMVTKAERGYRKVISSDFVARQQAPEIFDMNASLYAYSPDFLRRGLGVLDGYCEIIRMEDTAVLDLDHPNDFELMEVIARHLFETRGEFAVVYENILEKN